MAAEQQPHDTMHDEPSRHELERLLGEVTQLRQQAATMSDTLTALRQELEERYRNGERLDLGD